MRGGPSPFPEDLESLRCAAVAIAQSGACSRSQPSFALKAARAHVWAVYVGEDPRLAHARVVFGQATVDEAVRAGVLQEWLARLDRLFAHTFFDAVARLKLTLPVRREVA